MRGEEVDWVDADDRVIGRLDREEARRVHAAFRVAHVFLFDAQGRLLIHQLARSKRFAGHWGSSVAGGVAAGEAPEDAGRREVEEELGIEAPPLRFLGKAHVQDEAGTRFVYLYAGRLDAAAPLRPDPQEVAAVEFLPLDALRRIVRGRERSFTPAFLTAFALFERGAVA